MNSYISFLHIPLTWTNQSPEEAEALTSVRTRARELVEELEQSLPPSDTRDKAANAIGEAVMHICVAMRSK